LWRCQSCAMSKRSSKSKRRSKTLPALGFAGVSLSMASGACASTGEASANTPPTSQSQNQKIFLGEEEIFDVSLSTFYVFDKENGGATPLAQHLKLARGGGCGCGHGGGCGYGGCGFHGGCRCGGRFFRGVQRLRLRRLRLRRMRDLLDMATSWLVLGRVYASG
jgi:hypothetical protein